MTDHSTSTMLRYILEGSLLEKTQPERYAAFMGQTSTPMAEDVAHAYAAMFFQMSAPEDYAQFRAEIDAFLGSVRTQLGDDAQ